MLNDERFCICTVYIIRMSVGAANNLYYFRYFGCTTRAHVYVCVCVCVCLCVSVRSFLPPCASTPRNVGTYVRVHHYTENSFIYYNRDLKMLHSEATASFACLECH